MPAPTDNRIQQTALLAKAIGHPARIQILELLAEVQTCICGDITDRISLAQSTISQHLKVLRQAGLIRGEIDGVRTCYCLDPAGIEQLAGHLGALTEQLRKPQSTDCC